MFDAYGQLSELSNWLDDGMALSKVAYAIRINLTRTDFLPWK